MYGETADKILKQSKARGIEPPAKIANKPEIEFGLDLYYQAFIDLDTCRVNGIIPWTTIKDYALVHDYSEDQTEDLFYIIRAMDKVYLEHLRKKT